MSFAFLNGRFLTQPVTGVQRFAVEITAAIDRLAAAGEWPETAVLVPRSPRPTLAARPGATPPSRPWRATATARPSCATARAAGTRRTRCAPAR